MIFWDSSAIVPLLVDEPESSTVGSIARDDPVLVVWWGTRIECASALSRLEREGGLAVEETEIARDLLSELSECWAEVLPTDPLRRQAERLLLRHPLRAADALQLAAATAWAESEPDRHPLCTLDDRLAEAARGEGFKILP